MTEKEEKAIEIVKKFNIENRYRDGGVINNSIDTVIKALEQKDKEIQELKEKWNKDTHILQNQLDLANADRVVKDKIIKQYENMILGHKKQLNKSGIYGYDYDLKLIESEGRK